MWYVYIVRSALDSNLYIGSTNDLKRRLNEHNNGLVKRQKIDAHLSSRPISLLPLKKKPVLWSNIARAAPGMLF